MMDIRGIEDRWTAKASTILKGRTIEDVRYLTEEETDEAGWYNRPLVMFLDSGDMIVAMSDDEGNDGGSLSYLGGVLPAL
jgi:hypothetical protein